MALLSGKTDSEGVSGETYTRYLTVSATTAVEFTVQLSATSPISIAQAAVRKSCELRYSPVMPAFLAPGEGPPALPLTIDSIAFLFANAPYKALGLLKPQLTAEELTRTFFTEGLASILFVNCSCERARELIQVIGTCALEFWPIRNGILDVRGIVTEMAQALHGDTDVLELPTGEEPEISVYVEQIAASASSLWASYSIYYPEEKKTLHEVSRITRSLVEQYRATRSESPSSETSLVRQKKANAIVSALVELSAALSYAVTQGTSGCVPILWNRSPFPHHSLLGIGGSVRALTKFTRYLESAFMTRSASKVIRSHYSQIKHLVPASIATYMSGANYKFPEPGKQLNELFDSGGDFNQGDQIPLLTHFSLRHGFMESKFSVTAASEALTAEIMPQWTLMTLSHEVMHSRVRTIIQALFGHRWDEHEYSLIGPDYWKHFCNWLDSRKAPKETDVATALRNVILNFCYAIDQSGSPVPADKDAVGRRITYDRISECYSRHKQLAVELIVHFHDYYFAYAYQPKMYMMSLWASWTKVAAPFTRTLEYLTRSLATVACGTGLPPREAFDFAVEVLKDALDALEAAGVQSPLFAELRRLTGDEAENSRAFFKPCYYLIDQVRLFFASPSIASKIDRVETDPFAEGSTSAEDYSANVYVFTEGTELLSPIRYSLAALFSTLSRKLPVNDVQWLTAWNYMVISSQESNT
jgi:hypothetical protein